MWVFPIKFNLKTEATYNKPGVEDSSENRAFKTSARELYEDSDIAAIIEDSFDKLNSEEEEYTSRGSGFSLEKIDGVLLAVYQFSPMSGSSYIPLPTNIDNKKATINTLNDDQQCFKWSILARHVIGDHKNEVGKNYEKYTQHQSKYNFTGISFPTPLSDVKIFERNNPTVSINIYGIDKKIQPRSKLQTHVIFPLKVADIEKENHFDLLFVTNEINTHYVYISSFSRLVRSQKTLHTGHVHFCKRCFSTFDNRVRLNKLSGQAALDRHKKICGSHKPIMPIIPAEGETLQFSAWNRTVRHPIVLYGDFEALLVKKNVTKGKNTTILHEHKPMSFGIYVVVSEEVPLELLDKFDIPTRPIIFRGCEARQEVSKKFVELVMELTRRIEKLLKTNAPIIMSEEDIIKHNKCIKCEFCECELDEFTRVRDHCHLTGKFRHTLCSKCNLSLQQPKFVPCFLHNLTNYDAHFIVTELGCDSNGISVIPNSEEKFITFSKHVSNTFTVRFIDTFRFMATSLSKLAANLVTAGLSNFVETAKVFLPDEMKLVTRKGVYPYEYTESWGKLLEITLPPKEDFYSTLTEEHIKDDEYKFAKDVWAKFNCQTLGEYSDLYLKIDVLLLADVFENFRNLCLSTYNLDPAFYYTAPAISFDAMLKKTTVKLELLSDYDMILAFEKGKNRKI